jgi:peptidoglycan hydrolase-like protein with peptidoglycan-binding domain
VIDESQVAPEIAPVTVLPPELGRANDGSRRRRTALAVLAAAALAGAGGMYVGNRIQSPADRAAASAAPEPSLITVPVELRSLSSELVLAGQVAYNEPTPIQLAGSVGIEAGEAAVVTDMRPIDDVIQEGDVILEVTGRPVLALQGDVPMYRRLVIGSEGPDVGQLEQALVRLGYDAGTVDTVFDEVTAAAVEQMYADAGYVAKGPSVEERDALVNSQAAVRQAEDNLRAAQKAVADASRPLRESERLQLERTLQQARQAVPDARAAADAARVAADQSIATAQAALDAARIARDAAVAQRDQAQQGAIDPQTGEPYSADQISELQVMAAEAEQALVAADGSLATARTQAASSIDQADRAIADARFQLQLVEAQYAETTAPGDVTALQEAVAAAQAAVDASNVNLAALQAATGPRIPPGEIVFVPVLPSNLTESYVALGATVQGVLGTLATTDTLITARVSRVDSALVAVGAAVEVEIRGAGVTTTGTVLSVGAPAASPQPGGEGSPPQQGTGRLEVTIAPDDPATVRNYVFWDARIVVSVAATDGEVLVVPVAALTVGPDQVSQLEVERAPATDASPAVTEVVKVEVGLTANGLAEVRPLEPGQLNEGDRVVIGVETGERQNEDDTEGPSVPNDDSGGDDSGVSGGDDSGDSGDESAASPLAELLGYDFDPVEQRRLQLQIEEQTAECMRDLGFEYQPVDYQAMSNPEDELMFTDPKGFGEKYGYGIMRNYELYESGEAPPPDQGFVDPNQEYVNSLSPEEQTAYYEALYGSGMAGEAVAASIPGDGAASEGTVAPPTPEQMGCNGQAYAEVYGDNPADDPEVQEALSDYYTNLENDPRLDDANRLWGTCMAETFSERGIDPTPDDPNRMYEVVDRLKIESLGLEVVEVANQAEMDEYFNSGQPVYSASSDETGRGFVYLGEPEVLSGDEIDRLTGIEVELWKQDQACQEGAGLAELRRQLELEVVDQISSQFPELAG